MWRIFIKMEQERPDNAMKGEEGTIAYRIILNFMENYDRIIKPQLEKGKLNSIKFLIGEECMRGNDIINQTFHFEENGAYAKYRMAIQYLSGILEKEDFTQGFLQEKILPSLDRQIADLDLILSQNPYYKSLRKKEQ